MDAGRPVPPSEELRLRPPRLVPADCSAVPVSDPTAPVPTPTPISDSPQPVVSLSLLSVTPSPPFTTTPTAAPSATSVSVPTAEVRPKEVSFPYTVGPVR